MELIKVLLCFEVRRIKTTYTQINLSALLWGSDFILGLRMTQIQTGIKPRNLKMSKIMWDY